MSFFTAQRARISRSLTTVFILTFIQSVSAPIVMPEVFTPSSSAAAVTTTYNATTYTNGTTYTVPSGVTYVSFQVKGAAGGYGGMDGSTSGGVSTDVGYVSAVFDVNPGDVIQLFPGKVGGNGTTNARGSGGATGGAGTISNAPYLIEGTYYASTSFAGGNGGNAGLGESGSFSGGGGGGGAASIVVINYKVVLIAGGGGGGGGAGNGSSNSPVAWNGTYVSSGSRSGGTGGIPAGNADGGGGGGGGGGYMGGAGGASVYRSSEYAGTSGSRGNNFIDPTGSSALNTAEPANGVGFINMTVNPNSVSACATDVQTNDIYTIVKVTQLHQCTWSVPADVSVIDLFAVGGGGGGGGDGGGGGGGGAAISRTAIAVAPSSTINLKVGYGGFGSSWGGIVSPQSGDSTTVQISTGTIFAALGGSPGVWTPGGAGGAGGTASNGGFAGGAGGAGSGTTNVVGTAGKRGISNYYYGTQATYGGGGGGGTHTGSAVQTPAAGADGGGQGSYANTVSTNLPGETGAANRGGGGGGGAATGSGLKVHAGSGGSGIILIRYATNAADSFPSALSSALAARYSPGDLQLLDTSRKGWIDSSGTNSSVANSSFRGTPTISSRGATDGINQTGSNKTLLVAAGTISDGVTLSNLPTGYTLFHIARYVTNGSRGRIIASSTGNWLSGHFNGNTGQAHHNAWLTPENNNTGRSVYNWVLSTDQIRMYRANGISLVNKDYFNANNQSTSNSLAINNDVYGQYSTWENADLLVFNRQLQVGEIAQLEQYLARVNGLTLESSATHSETDTAASLNGNYFLTSYTNGVTFNDTFTVEAWVKPNSSCATGICQFISKEYTILFGMQYGRLYWATYGNTVGGWSWTDTGVYLEINAWHHVSMVKQYSGDKNGSLLFYIDGQLVHTVTGSPYAAGTNYNSTSSSYRVYDPDNRWFVIGGRADGGQLFYGTIDEVKVWSVARSQSQIQSDLASNDTSSAQLQMYFDFNSNSLSMATAAKVPNIAKYASPGTDANVSSTMSFVDVKEITVLSPYTTIKFPRTYITQFGGWKVPIGMPAATVIAVAGGGGGGYGGSSNTPAGAGGGGGVSFLSPQVMNGGSIVPIRVGQGGVGGWKSEAASSRNGQDTVIGINGITTVFGGGGGGDNLYPGAGGSSLSTSGGSGGNSYLCSGTPPNASPSSGSPLPTETVPSGNNGGYGIWGWGGSGGGARGAATNGVCNSNQAGVPGPGFVDAVTNIEYGRGGSADRYSVVVSNTGYTTANNGWGGIISYSNGNSNGRGYSGAAGVVVIRFITATKPAYTPPTNAYLNVGMTETFTTNVASDSATAGLTRTFKWESTTAGSGGTYSTLKQGTGASNASFSWVPTDTSTSGTNYLYRVIVTDSDTAGLSIQDTSTAVYAVINQPLNVSGVSAIAKTINIARSETFTITLGTSTYRPTLSPVIPGITLDTSTSGLAVLKISDTAAVGTFMETLTVTDSVSASVVIPLSITITPPPLLTNTGEVITSGQVFNLDSSVSASYNPVNGAAADISGAQKAITVNGGSTYSNDYSGNMVLSTSQYLSVAGIQQMSSFTIEAFIKLNSITNRTCVFTSENTGYQLCIDSTRTVYGGFYSGTAWTYKRTSQTVPLGSWTHLLVTFDSSTAGTKMELYFNGAVSALSDANQNAGLITTTPGTNRSFINHDYPTNNAVASSMSIGFVRLYNRSFVQTDVSQNYNATKTRFDTSNLNQLKPTQKYGVLTLESFTATSGGDTKTITFANGNRQGVIWDTTSTPGQIKLSVGESLTVGTYYDTVTVTDNFGASTFLPLTFTVTKADTITVTSGPSLTTVYTGQAPTNAPVARVTGLVGRDTATVTTSFSIPCALGGSCSIGDLGPGGGRIFYISPTVINVASGVSDGGIYLEVAPRNWNGNESSESGSSFATKLDSVAGTSSAIGTGAENTRLLRNALGDSATAATLAMNRTFRGLSDWFVPSYNELTAAITTLAPLGLGEFTTYRNLWSSTQNPANSNQGYNAWSSNPPVLNTLTKTDNYFLRPIRAFSPLYPTETSTPINVDTYTALGSDLTFQIGALSNYQAVTYETSTLKITQANQNKLIINLYGAVAGSPFLIQTSGGSGTGEISEETVTAGTTATGCAISNHVLTNTSPSTQQLTCSIKVTKAASRNYLAESITATVYFMLFVNNMPTNQVGSGSTIALNGMTSLSIDDSATVRAPLITSISISGTTVTINGEGLGNAQVSLRFERNVITSATPTGTSAAGVITVTLPGGARSGYVHVTLPSGAIATSPYLTLP